MMSEKRFIIKKGSSGDYDIYDNLKEDYFIADSSLPVNSYVEEIVDLLNEQQATIEELRLQEKEKGVPVFVVRDGKNPVALFFNEQRAMYYCQENVAHLTYQQEKWCRVE